MFKKFVFLVFAIVLVLLSQKCKTVEPEPDYTYSIDSLWWSDSIDANHDGFTSYRKLNFDVHLKEDVSRPIRGRVFYQPVEASEYTFYAFSKKNIAVGNNQDNIFGVSIGDPNKELDRGLYNFKIEIYEEGGSRREAVTDKADSLILCNNAFEKTETDNNYSLNVYWRDAFDNDKDGYWSYAYLVLDANNDADVTRSLEAKVYYKSASETEYSEDNLYADINFTITNSSPDDSVSIPIGIAPNDFDHGEYDFRVELYEAGTNTLVIIDDEDNTSALKNVKLETDDEDTFHFSIDNVWWTDFVDLDHDSYTSRRTLHFDVNVDRDGQSFPVYAKVFNKSPDSTEYNLYDSTAYFNVTGSGAADAYSVTVGTPNAELDSASYDFLISIFQTENDTTEIIRYTISSVTVDTLKLQKFETAHQDSTGI